MLVVQEYFNKKKDIQKELLVFLDNNSENEENYQNLQQLFEDQQIGKNVHELKLILNLINKISKNHHRYPNFFAKIEKVLLIFKDEIKQNFKNADIFLIFQNNKRILLFLIQNEILLIDQEVFNQMINQDDYQEFFTPELRKQLDTKKVKYNLLLPLNLEDLPKNFDEKRLIGENDDALCEIIRNDDIENFIIYVNKNDCSLKSVIDSSIYETNNLLLKQTEVTLIKYAAFHGSTQIFKYLYLNKVQLTSSLWIYAIHGDNPEILSILEDNNIIPEKKMQNNNEEYDDDDDDDDEDDDDENSDDGEEGKEIYSKKYFRNFLNILVESIKCHHIDIANYLYDKLCTDDENIKVNILKSTIKYYNFNFIRKEIINQDPFFYYLCKYDYISPICLILKNDQIGNQINECKLIQKNNRVEIEDKVIPLWAAIESENIELVNILLNNNINVNETMEHTREYFYKYDKTNIKKEKFKKTTSLILAVKRGNIEIIKILLSCKNIDVNALYVLSDKSKRVELINLPKWSVEDPNIINEKSENIKKTALHVAVENENIEIIELLLANKNIDINNIAKYSKSSKYCDPRERSYSGELEYKKQNIEKTPLIIAIEKKKY